MVNEIKGSMIDSVVQNLANSKKAEQSQLSSSASASSDSSSNGASEVTLTNTAEKLQALEAQIQQQPVVDSQRVQAVKQSIFDGTFNMDNQRTAEKLLDFENLLGNEPNKE